VLAGDGEVRVSITRACSAMTAAWAAMVASRSGVESGDGIVASGLRHCLWSVEVEVVGVETADGALCGGRPCLGSCGRGRRLSLIECAAVGRKVRSSVAHRPGSLSAGH